MTDREQKRIDEHADAEFREHLEAKRREEMMTPDREQIRRDTERRPGIEKIREALRHLVAQDRFEAPLAVDAGVELDALLSELEQAEQREERLRSDLGVECRTREQAERERDEARARLVKYEGGL